MNDKTLITIPLTPRMLAFYWTDDGWFRELGVELVSGGVRGTRKQLIALARYYSDDAEPLCSALSSAERRPARDAAKRIRSKLESAR